MRKIFALLLLSVVSLCMYAEETPGFPGGAPALKKYLTENVRYPQIAKENGIEGVVVVGFIVFTDGTLNDIKILKFVDPELETEVVRVVKGMPAWIPAEKNGAPIEAPSKVEVPFILDE